MCRNGIIVSLIRETCGAKQRKILWKQSLERDNQNYVRRKLYQSTVGNTRWSDTKYCFVVRGFVFWVLGDGFLLSLVRWQCGTCERMHEGYLWDAFFILKCCLYNCSVSEEVFSVVKAQRHVQIPGDVCVVLDTTWGCSLNWDLDASYNSGRRQRRVRVPGDVSVRDCM